MKLVPSVNVRAWSVSPATRSGWPRLRPLPEAVAEWLLPLESANGSAVSPSRQYSFGESARTTDGYGSVGAPAAKFAVSVSDVFAVTLWLWAPLSDHEVNVYGVPPR